MQSCSLQLNIAQLIFDCLSKISSRRLDSARSSASFSTHDIRKSKSRGSGSVFSMPPSVVSYGSVLAKACVGSGLDTIMPHAGAVCYFPSGFPLP